ncbi:MAG: hypothetical protein QNI90_01200 [Dinoroseobacter sp.]|nr:hypothetical protein [Dinoroseobacter sp.]
MESNSFEKQEALAAMNWEKRLKKARAQREAVLRERATEAPVSNGLRPVSIFELAEKLRPGSNTNTIPPRANKQSLPSKHDPAAPTDAKHAAEAPGNPFSSAAPEAARKPFNTPSDPVSPVDAKHRIGAPEDLSAPLLAQGKTGCDTELNLQPRQHAVTPRRVWKRGVYIGLSFCAGIGVGLGLMAYQTGFTAGLPRVADNAPSETATPATASDMIVPPTLNLAPAVAEARVQRGSLAETLTSEKGAGTHVELSAEEPLVISELDVEAFFRGLPIAKIAPEPSSERSADLFPLAALGTPVLLGAPDAGEPPQAVLRLSRYPLDNDVQTLQAVAQSLPFPHPAHVEDGPDPHEQVRPDGTATDALGGGEFLSGKQPQYEQGVTPTASAPPRARPGVPAAVIDGAENMATWIFVAGTARADAIASAQGAVKKYNMPVRAVNRVNYRISESQVRYYDASTAIAAKHLAAEIGARARDFTSSGIDPAEGTLEIYLAGKPIGGRARSPNNPVAMLESAFFKLRSGIQEFSAFEEPLRKVQNTGQRLQTELVDALLDR